MGAWILLALAVLPSRAGFEEFPPYPSPDGPCRKVVGDLRDHVEDEHRAWVLRLTWSLVRELPERAPDTLARYLELETVYDPRIGDPEIAAIQVASLKPQVSEVARGFSAWLTQQLLAGGAPSSRGPVPVPMIQADSIALIRAMFGAPSEALLQAVLEKIYQSPEVSDLPFVGRLVRGPDGLRVRPSARRLQLLDREDLAILAWPRPRLALRAHRTGYTRLVEPALDLHLGDRGNLGIQVVPDDSGPLLTIRVPRVLHDELVREAAAQGRTVDRLRADELIRQVLAKEGNPVARRLGWSAVDMNRAQERFRRQLEEWIILPGERYLSP